MLLTLERGALDEQGRTTRLGGAESPVESGPSIGIRYNGGIADLSDPSTDGDKQRNSAFQLQLGYMFGGK